MPAGLFEGGGRVVVGGEPGDLLARALHLVKLENALLCRHVRTSWLSDHTERRCATHRRVVIALGKDRPAFVGHRFRHDQHGLELHHARDLGELDPDHLGEVREVAQGQHHDHVELPGDVVAGAHPEHALDGLLELQDGLLAVLAQLHDRQRLHGDAERRGVDDGAVAADRAALLEAAHAAEHGRRRQVELGARAPGWTCALRAAAPRGSRGRAGPRRLPSSVQTGFSISAESSLRQE